ncbi:transcriptional regulator [Niveispirillum sp. SYP-B3756]|uniref:helix-turn-helix domain-containing protein n=1 Tax=Niveispirillum sp. SYP-B3756 TaxID=2662178 RepID=UPI001291715C|nr:helix-turn-helix domain-containing protein [Niveispirillum sp. SYP-B3756]MQP64739.1 transcriptional regulator [Niveispirillum sp. SYP-B3756]
MAKRHKAADWHPADIKAALAKAGYSLVGLARESGLPNHACRHALRLPYHDAQAAIAKVLKVRPEQIWPSRYDASGLSLHPPRRLHGQHINTVNAADPLQNMMAA